MPRSSSMTCAYMFRPDRKTDSLARPPFWRRSARRIRRLRRSCSSLLVSIARPLLLLAFLTEDSFVRVLDALPLIRFRAAERTNLRRNLTNTLRIDAGDRNRRGALGLDLNVRRDRIDHVMAVAELQLQVPALDRGAIADAVDLEHLREALTDARDQALREAAIGAPHHPRPLGIRTGLDPE